MKMIQPSCFTYGLALLCAIGVMASPGCNDGAALKGRTSSAGGAAGSVTSQVGGAGAAGSAGKRCQEEGQASAPIASKNCAVSARTVDPVFTCGQADCAVRKALDLTCDTRPLLPSLSATAEGSALLSLTQRPDSGSTAAHLVTVTAADSRVEDVVQLNDGSLSWDWILESVMSSSSSGKRWIFAGGGTSLTALHETDTRWVHSSIPLSQNTGAYLSACMVDDNLGYLTYGTDADSYAPHLVTWDGSCWTDKTLASQGTPASTVLAVDDKKQPWVAWYNGIDSLYLRHPNGDTQNLLSNIMGDAMAGTTLGAPIRILPGGLDGSTTFPLVAAPAAGGIRLFSRNATDPGWRSALLPDLPYSGTKGDGCPSGLPTDDCRKDPCLGATSCDAQVTIPSAGFDLVRTKSGRTYVAQVVTSSQGTYALQEAMSGYEFPTCYCDWTETSGTGTADLILTRVTEAEPIISHFRFDMGGARETAARDLVVAARGDTLLIAAQLGGSRVTTLTYIEIDSTRLP